MAKEVASVEAKTQLSANVSDQGDGSLKKADGPLQSHEVVFVLFLFGMLLCAFSCPQVFKPIDDVFESIPPPSPPKESLIPLWLSWVVPFKSSK